ncbi:hypothetical protein VTL71DRAFT_6334 [Oculimacula yallundae]|uniref:Uncharacterized protein n=1 Tax=Oculimacula yallundae TaxID=86028 RepID=A0ABR4BWP8_9HELO
MSKPTIKTKTLLTLSTIFGSTFIAGGVNAILRPSHALSFFELYLPLTSSAHDQGQMHKEEQKQYLEIIEALMIVYGIRDIFMGVAMCGAAYFAYFAYFAGFGEAGARAIQVKDRGEKVKNERAASFDMSRSGHRSADKLLGCIVLAGAAVAVGDGFACKLVVGKGEWGHWGYAPMLAVVGGLLVW